MTRKRWVLTALCAAVAGDAAAQSEISTYDLTSQMLANASRDGRTDGLFGSVALGYLATTGNTDGSNLNGQASIGHVGGIWRNVATLKAIRGSNNGIITAEEYSFNGQSDYRIGEWDYVFAALSYTHDSFGPYRKRASEVVGYGYRLIATDEHLLDAQLGVGARQSREQTGTRQREGIVAGRIKYDWQINPTTVLTERFGVEVGESNTYGESVTAVTANLRGTLAMSISYTVKHNTDVAPGLERTDTATMVSVIYGF